MAIDPVSPKEFVAESIAKIRDMSHAALADRLVTDTEAFLVESSRFRLSSSLLAATTQPVEQKTNGAQASDAAVAAEERALLALQRTLATIIFNLPGATTQSGDRGTVRANLSASASREIERRYANNDDGTLRASLPQDEEGVSSSRLGRPAAGDATAAVQQMAGAVPAAGGNSHIPEQICVVVYWQTGAKPDVVDIRVERDTRDDESDPQSVAPCCVFRFDIDARDLGRVSVVLASMNGRISASLAADHPEMAMALREHKAELGASLEEAGVAVAELMLHEGLAGDDSATPATIL